MEAASHVSCIRGQQDRETGRRTFRRLGTLTDLSRKTNVLSCERKEKHGGRLSSGLQERKEKADAPRQRQLRPLQTCKVPIGSPTSSWRWIAIRQALGAACRPSSPENAQIEGSGRE